MENHHHCHRHHRSRLVAFFLLAAAAAAAAFCQQPRLSSGQPSSVLDPGFDCVAGNCTSAGSPPVYIVHVRRPEHMVSAGPEELEAWHRSFLPTALLDSGEPRMVYSYDRAMSGFAARLTTEEAEAVRGRDGVLAVHPDEPLEFQTTYAPDFMGLRERGGLRRWEAPNRGDGVIIGVVDSGINHLHVSFGDAGMPNPPDKWSGLCEFNGGRTCNKKLLGARNYDRRHREGETPPYDATGHGTHVAGAAAGGTVADASIRGLAGGVASGAAPRAHLAVYKARKMSQAVMAVDQAINDGVDIICFSLQSQKPNRPFYEDGLAIAALSAVRHGVHAVAAASNYGPEAGTIRNDAPWMLTVGASTTDRLLKTTITLGNNEEITGESLNTVEVPKARLVYPGYDGNLDGMACRHLRKGSVSGMIVMCHTLNATQQAEAVKWAGGAAVILMNSKLRGNTVSGIPDVAIPAVRLGFAESSRILKYVGKRLRLTALVSASATAFDATKPAPAVADFSSRGPSAVNGDILKPDILGPGVNVLAASTSSNTSFALRSGTSTAAPFVAGVAAILIHSRPGWTPAMVKSALMTTADPLDDSGNAIVDRDGAPASLNAVGAGQVKPMQADTPGLVYDLTPTDYLRYLCGLGYSDKDVTILNGGERVHCKAIGRVTPQDLNYPSISVKMKRKELKAVSRTVTSVERGNSSYKPEVDLPAEGGVQVDVFPPDTLDFTGEGQQREFKVSFRVKRRARRGEVRGRLRWVSKSHQVSTPLLITVA